MAIPSEAQRLVNKFRLFIKDEEIKNDLLEAQENTDEELYEYLVDAVDEINNLNEPLTTYTIYNFPSWSILKLGAILQYLSGAGIHSARNTFSYNDGSGINVSDADVWGRYINYYNVLINKHREVVSSFKKRINIEDCYGGIHSQYNDFG